MPPTRRTHNEVAYNGYGTYRLGCAFSTRMNAWQCAKGNLVPARFLVEQLVENAAYPG